MLVRNGVGGDFFKNPQGLNLLFCKPGTYLCSLFFIFFILISGKKMIVFCWMSVVSGDGNSTKNKIDTTECDGAAARARVWFFYLLIGGVLIAFVMADALISVQYLVFSLQYKCALKCRGHPVITEAMYTMRCGK